MFCICSYSAVMRRLASLIATIAVGLPLPSPAETLPGPVQAVVDRVVDGDTIAVRARIWLGQEVSVLVRVRGIDAPERRGRCAEERRLAERATAVMAEAVADGRLGLRQVERDKYGGRVVADVVLVDGGDLAGRLLESRTVRPYGSGGRASWCEPG